MYLKLHLQWTVCLIVLEKLGKTLLPLLTIIVAKTSANKTLYRHYVAIFKENNK